MQIGVARPRCGQVVVALSLFGIVGTADAAQPENWPWEHGTEYHHTAWGPYDDSSICPSNGPHDHHGLSELDSSWSETEEWGNFVQGLPCDYIASVLGQDDCCAFFGSYLSRCYTRHYTQSDAGGAEPWFGQYGFARGLDLGWGVSPGDYPPVSTDVRGPNSPLIPAGAPIGEGRHYPERPVVGEVDLITGQPLVREIDLELPFGGAVYRHVRTYSEHPGIGSFDVFGRHATKADQLMWDWYGQGWMMGENPLFLFDAAWVGVVSASDARNENGSPPRCYFVPDAHHAIPFEQVELGPGQVAYVAPPQFDAVLLHSGGVWDSDAKAWDEPPREFKVLLHNRSVVYTIRPY